MTFPDHHDDSNLEANIGRLGHGDVVPGEAQHRPVPDAGHVDDPGPAPGGLESVQQQVGQQEVAQVVGLELGLLPVLGDQPPGGDQPRIVDLVTTL